MAGARIICVVKNMQNNKIPSTRTKKENYMVRLTPSPPLRAMPTKVHY